jgi:cytochrome c553
MKATIIFLTVLLAVAVLSNCGQSPSNQHVAGSPHAEAIKYMKTNCNSCHNPTAGPNARVAPPMAAVRDAYLAAYPDSIEFSNAFVDFTGNPDRKHALMPDAIAQFGLMPAMNLNREMLQKLAAYLYTEQPEAPDWYTGTPAQSDEENPFEVGLEYALGLKQILGKNLMAALETGGPVYALDFCNTRALPLTDSMSAFFGHEVVRLSDKPRNPKNQADEDAKTIIDMMKRAIAAEREPQPAIRGTYAYYPIITNEMCLQCHGTPGNQIGKATLEAIANKYPGDQAIGYGVNELRGVFRVRL